MVLGACVVIHSATAAREHEMREQQLGGPVEHFRVAEGFIGTSDRSVDAFALVVEQGSAREYIGEAMLGVGDAQIGEGRVERRCVVVRGIRAESIECAGEGCLAAV